MNDRILAGKRWLALGLLFAGLIGAFGESDYAAAITEAHGFCLNNQYEEAAARLASLGEISDPYWKARYHLVSGLVEIGRNDNDRAEEHFTETERLAEEEVYPIDPGNQCRTCGRQEPRGCQLGRQHCPGYQ